MMIRVVVVLGGGLCLSAASCAAIWGFQDATGPADGGADVAPKQDATAEAAPIDTRLPDVMAVVDVKAIIDVKAEPVAMPPADHVAPPSGPTCTPACAPGFECEKAVGGAAVCVNASATCAESTDCPPPTCCVWLDETSRTGSCEGAGMTPASVSCLCQGIPIGPPGQSDCRHCGPPAGTLGPITICSDSP
jgi:hypothetical protein